MRRHNPQTSGGVRLTWALAVSLLAHACAVGAFYVMPAGLPHDEPFQGGPSGGQVLRPVQVTLVAAPRPRRERLPAAVAEAAPPPSPPRFDPAIAKPDARLWRLTPMPMPPIVRPRIVADGPSSAVKPPAMGVPASTKVTASPGGGGEVQEVRRAASAGQVLAGSGPAAGDKPATGLGARTGLGGATAQEAGGDGTRTGGPGGTTAGQPATSTARSATSVEIVDLPTPEYPPRSRRLGEEGLVLLEVEVLPDGRAGTVRVLQAPDYPRLVDAAIATVRSAAFRPATADGRPVRAFVEVPIRFRLD
jgi:protein TonB